MQVHCTTLHYEYSTVQVQCNTSTSHYTTSTVQYKYSAGQDHPKALRRQRRCLGPTPRRGFLDGALEIWPGEIRSREQRQDSGDDLHALRWGAQELYWEEVCFDGGKDGSGGGLKKIPSGDMSQDSRNNPRQKQRPDTFSYWRWTLVENIQTINFTRKTLIKRRYLSFIIYLAC